ncbi:MAG: hypothetical protein BMS9Abin07_1477 [Acidimicrobiia bacterium]|nr:MAG: hypothetical protein BMS9Abin07_1477 [Acidimicrobiia bacterium]
MTSQIVFLSTLADSAEPAEFERFVMEEVLPLARALPSVVSYDVIRVEGFLEGREGLPHVQYVDIAEVSNASEYERDVTAALDGPAGVRFDKTWTGFVAEWVPLHGTVLD